MKLIILNDSRKTIINLERVEYINFEKVKGCNPYFNFNFMMNSGKYKQIRYEEYEERYLLEDVEYIHGFAHSRT
ncbi:MAG: hypothetical protein ACRCX2_19465 [Paraclostridium sp.]